MIRITRVELQNEGFITARTKPFEMFLQGIRTEATRRTYGNTHICYKIPHGADS